MQFTLCFLICNPAAGTLACLTPAHGDPCPPETSYVRGRVRAACPHPASQKTRVHRESQPRTLSPGLSRSAPHVPPASRWRQRPQCPPGARVHRLTYDLPSPPTAPQAPQPADTRTGASHTRPSPTPELLHCPLLDGERSFKDLLHQAGRL